MDVEERKERTREVEIDLYKTVKVRYTGTKTVLEPNSKYLKQGFRKASPKFIIQIAMERIRTMMENPRTTSNADLKEVLELYYDGRLLEDIGVELIPLVYKVGIEVEE